MTQRKLLLTGFEPFAHYTINPSWEAARTVAAAFPDRVTAHRLAVDHVRARDQLLRLLDIERPDVCLCMGLAAGDRFRLERCARKPVQFADAPFDHSHQGNFAFDRIEQTLERIGADWKYSDDCGQYVCESTYWALLQHASEKGWPARCGFLHVPADSAMWPAQRTVEVVHEIVGDFLAAESE
jgi:pyroglutamyl-peptidase